MSHAVAVPGPRALIRWRNAVYAVFALCGFVSANWVTRVPNIRDLLHASTQEMGLLVLGVAVGSIAGLMVASRIVTRIGATRAIRWCFSLSLAALVAGGLVVALVPSFVTLFIALVVFGMGASTTDVSMNLSGAANERAIGKTLMPRYHAAFSLGTVIGAGFGALVVLARIPVSVHFMGIGVAGLVLIPIIVHFLQPAEQPASAADHAEEAAAPRSRLGVWRDPRVLFIGLIVLGMAFAEGSANDWLSLAMVDGHAFTDAAGAASFGLFVTAMTVARIGGTVLIDRFGRVVVLRASAAVAFAGLVLVIFGPGTIIALVGVALWGLGAALGFPIGMSAASDDPKRAAASVSAVATIGYCAFLVGPPLIGLLGQHFGLLHALIAVLALVAVAGLASGAAKLPAGVPAPVAPDMMADPADS